MVRSKGLFSQLLYCRVLLVFKLKLHLLRGKFLLFDQFSAKGPTIHSWKKWEDFCAPLLIGGLNNLAKSAIFSFFKQSTSTILGKYVFKTLLKKKRAKNYKNIMLLALEK